MDDFEESSMSLDSLIETHLYSALFGNYTATLGFEGYLNTFLRNMKEMFYGMMRGTQDAEELRPYLPAWFNEKYKCTDFVSQYSLQWEKTFREAFERNCTCSVKNM